VPNTISGALLTECNVDWGTTSMPMERQADWSKATHETCCKSQRKEFDMQTFLLVY